MEKTACLEDLFSSPVVQQSLLQKDGKRRKKNGEKKN